ncbi:MAG: hypothetical protein IJK35_08160 [Oscillospiraceae bacterium]|nr:hypothetical protein [Oscillospiraceae bacterium]
MKKLSVTCSLFSALAGLLHVLPLVLLLDMYDQMRTWGHSFQSQFLQLFREGWTLEAVLLLLYLLFLAISILCVFIRSSQRSHRLRLLFIFYLASSVVSYLVSVICFDALSPLGIFYSLLKLLVMLAVLFVHKNTDEAFF